MPSIISTLRNLCVITTIITLSPFASGINVSPDAPNQRGISIFYKIQPTNEQIYSFAHGDFDKPPTTAYECPPDPAFPFDPPAFGCTNRALRTSPSPSDAPAKIFTYGTPDPTCLSMGVAFEHLQWATWTHACWGVPRPAIDSPEGRAEVAFQSQALRYRRTVLYQHNRHLQTLNQRIADLRLVADAEMQVMRSAMAARVRELDGFYAVEVEKKGADRNRLLAEKDAKIKAVWDDGTVGIKNREKAFWKDSWGHRWKTVEIDHLVGDYFEWWIRGWSLDNLDWAGMGQPKPPFPPPEY